ADRAVVADRDAADDVGHAAALAGELGELVGHPLWREDAAALGGRFKRARVLSETLRGGLVVELAGTDKVSEERVLSAVLNAAVVTGVTVVHARVRGAALVAAVGDLRGQRGDRARTSLNLGQGLDFGGDGLRLLALVLDGAQLVLGQVAVLFGGASLDALDAVLDGVVLFALTLQVRVHGTVLRSQSRYVAPIDRGARVPLAGVAVYSGEGAGVQLSYGDCTSNRAAISGARRRATRSTRAPTPVAPTCIFRAASLCRISRAT